MLQTQPRIGGGPDRESPFMTQPATAAEPKPADKEADPSGQPREWQAHIWDGCSSPAWMRLIIRNRFAVNWRYVHIAVIITFVSLIHSLLRLIQTLIYGGRIRRTEIREAPIFVIGHWRTGTTLLHEYLSL